MSTIDSAYSAFAQGKLSLAAQLAHQVIKKNSSDPAANVLLSRLALAEQEVGLAATLLERAWAVSPRPSLLLDLANINVACRQELRAIQNLEELLRFDPSNLDVKIQLAGLMVSLGDFKAAEEQYRTVLERHSRSVQALRGMAQLNLIKSGDSLFHLLLEIASSQQSTLHNQMFASYSLSRVLDSEAMFSDASVWLSRANSIQRQLYPGDRESYLRRHLLYLESMSRLQVSGRRLEPVEDLRPIFIVGMPRSGTTLLERVISSHQCVTSGGELDYILGPMRRLFERTTGVGFPSFEEMTITQMQVCRDAYLRRLRSVCDTPIITDKTLANYAVIPLLVSLFPNSKVICLSRAEEDVALSILQQPFSQAAPHTCDQSLLAFSFASFKSSLLRFRDQYKDQLVVVNYEDFVSSTDLVGQALFSSLGLEWSPEYIKERVRDSAVHTFSSVEVRGPVTSSRIGKSKLYSRYLTPFRDALKFETKTLL